MFEDRLIFGEVMGKSSVSCISLTHGVQLTRVAAERIHVHVAMRHTNPSALQADAAVFHADCDKLGSHTIILMTRCNFYRPL